MNQSYRQKYIIYLGKKNSFNKKEEWKVIILDKDGGDDYELYMWSFRIWVLLMQRTGLGLPFYEGGWNTF